MSQNQIWETGPVPIYATPRLPPEVDGAVHTLGINRARLAIVLVLKAQPATIPAIATQTGLTTMTVNRYLLDLEQHGSVSASKPPNDPARRRSTGITWTLDKQQLQTEIQALNSILD